MPQQKRNILITRSLTEQQHQYAESLGLNPVEKPALEFEFTCKPEHVLKTINENLQASWVFTSQNGVKALELLLSEGLSIPTGTHCFAVGSKTQHALESLGLDAKIPSQQDGYHLAKLIIDQASVDSVIHFHGNLSRKEMRNKLTNNDIDVIELEVYQTIIHPVKLPEQPVDAALFYSPSAVEGFKQGQGFERPLPSLFAIGPTTATALKNETDQTVHTVNKPDTKVLLQTVSNDLSHK